MIDPDGVGELYRFAEGALQSLRDGVSKAQASNVPRQFIEGLAHGETPAPEASPEIVPDLNLPEDI